MIDTIIYNFIVLAGIAAYCFAFKRRKLFSVRILASIAVFFVYKLVLAPLILRSAIGEVFSYVGYLIDWGLLLCIVFISFKIKFITAVFCTTCGYCLQHISQRIWFLFANIIFEIPNELINNGIRVCIAAVIIVLFAISYKGVHPKFSKEPTVERYGQFFITFASLFISLGVEAFATSDLFSAKSEALLICNFISSIIFAVIIVMLSYNSISRKYAADENLVLKQMMEREREQYKIEQNIIDAINMKTHDLKNILPSLIGEKNSSEIEELKKYISTYDAIYKTGNKALDTVLTMKGLLCESKGIEFTCIADGKKLSFVKESEIYSLFGNLLDNCIEAVENLPKEQKVISLSVIDKGAGLNIVTKNYFEGEEILSGDLPKTTKKNKLYHGYGLKSIHNIVNKYDGEFEIEAKNNIFSVSILFV